MEKIINDGRKCPMGEGCRVDSPECRQCPDYVITSGYRFIRCLRKKSPSKSNHNVNESASEEGGGFSQDNQ